MALYAPLNRKIKHIEIALIVRSILVEPQNQLVVMDLSIIYTKSHPIGVTMTDETVNVDAVELATELTVAWLSNPNTRTEASEVPAFLGKMHETVSALLGGTTQQVEAQAPVEYTPAVSVRKSLASNDYIVSMIDGKPYKTLRRHLSTNGLTPEEYRARYNLKADYPLVAPSYSAARQAMAKKIGLGRKPGQSPKAQEAPKTAAKPARKGKTVADAKAAAQAHLSGSEG